MSATITALPTSSDRERRMIFQCLSCGCRSFKLVKTGFGGKIGAECANCEIDQLDFEIEHYPEKD